MARTREPQKLNYVKNPAPGSLLTVAAGGRAEAEFDFINDSPDVAAFELAVSGLPADWTAGVGAGSGTMAAASGGGALHLFLTPPMTASVGEYDFSVRILSGGDAIAAATALILRVEPPDEAAVAAALQAASTPPPLPVEPTTGGAVVFAPEPAPMIPDVAGPEPAAVVKPKPVARRRVPEPPVFEEAPVAAEAPPPVFEAAPPIAKAAPPVVKAAPPVVEAAPPVVEEVVSVRPEPPAPPVVPPPSAPVFIAPPPVPRMPSSAPEPPTPLPPPPAPSRPLAAAPVLESPTPAARPVPRPRPAAPPPPPEEEPVVVVDYQPTPARALLEEDDEEAPAEQEPSVVDLADGGAVALKPGETRLLRFTFTNDQARETTYVLDEDRSLPDDWVTLVQDQVNLTRNGQGDVSLRLSPPLNAEPGDYPFGVTLGPQGGVLTPRSLTLTVQATPAVKLTSKERTIKIGAMGSFADFHLSAESAGNADTAFRVAVMAPPSDSAGSGRTPLPVYGTPQWRYLFDKELETLRSPGSGRAPRPIPLRFRLQRTGPWWFGFRETHQVRVAAVPVTDAGNGGKPENAVEVTAVRQRFWPMPYLTIIPLLLLLMALFSGGANSVMVSSDSQYFDTATNTYWVASTGQKKQVTLKWDGPRLALLRLSGSLQTTPLFSRLWLGPGTYTPDAVTMDLTEPSRIYNYQISPVVGGSEQRTSVCFVQTSTSTPLSVSDKAGPARPAHVLSGNEVDVSVPQGGSEILTLRNDAQSENALNYWLVKAPSADSAFSFDHKQSVSLQKGQLLEYAIRAKGPVGTTDQLVFITTDAARSKLTINLTVSAPVKRQPK